MSSRTGGGVRDRLQTVVHYLTAFALAAEGYARLEEPGSSRAFVALCWASAAAIVAATVLHRRIERRFPPLQVLVHLVEASVCSCLFVISRHEGKVALPYAWLTAALLLFAVGLWQWVRFARAERPKRES